MVGAVLNRTAKNELDLLPAGYNYPLFFHRFYESEKKFVSLEGVVSIKYEYDFGQLPADWIENIKGPVEVLDWLGKHFAGVK